MSDYIIMLIILVFLGFTLLYKAKFVETNTDFFDIKNTMVMRGFWCLVIILVHVPEMYQNKIQDMIGSFAYIGVTFFFLTSAYGLTLSQDRNPDGIKFFWRKRLPRLMIVSWTVNISREIVLFALLREKINVYSLFVPDLWVRWLAACYFAFWLGNIISKKGIIWKTLTIFMIIVGSVTMYNLQRIGLVTSVTWCPECLGFVWGILLASNKNAFVSFGIKNWRGKWALSTLLSLVLGVGYLKFKHVPFWGDYILKIILGVAITLFEIIANLRINFGNRVGFFLGNISFEIYLIHGWVFVLLGRLLIWNSSGLFIIASMALTFIIAAIVHWISDKILNAVITLPPSRKV